MTASIRTRVLVAIALAVIAYVVFAPSDPDSTVETAASRRPSQLHVASTEGGRTRLTAPSASALANRVAAGESAGALFAAHSWYTPPPPPPPPAPAPAISEQQAAALRTPIAPPIPFAYMGTYTPDGAAPVFFLTQGDRVYNVRIGEVLDNKYSVDAFSNGQLVMTYMPLKIQQQLSVGATP